MMRWRKAIGWGRTADLTVMIPPRVNRIVGLYRRNDAEQPATILYDQKELNQRLGNPIL